MYNTGERSKPEKNYNKKRKTTFGSPLLPIKHPCKTPPLTNLRGGPDPRSPPSGSAHVVDWCSVIRHASVNISSYKKSGDNRPTLQRWQNASTNRLWQQFGKSNRLFSFSFFALSRKKIFSRLLDFTQFKTLQIGVYQDSKWCILEVLGFKTKLFITFIW